LLIEIACRKDERETTDEDIAYKVEVRMGIKTTLPTINKYVDIVGRFYQKFNPNKQASNMHLECDPADPTMFYIEL